MLEANDPKPSPVAEIQFLIDCYKDEPDDSKKGLHFEKILDAINNKYGIKPPDEIDELMLSTFNCNLGTARLCIYLGHYYHRLEKIEEALKCFERAYEIDQSYAPLANMARLYSYRSQYDKHNLQLWLHVNSCRQIRKSK
jgi:tetratricopeptide (TPR) repeat protein